MKTLIFIAAGGSFGAVSRFIITKIFSEVHGGIFPFATFFLNVSGSFLIGFFYCITDEMLVPANLRYFVSIGFLGAFTTFSTFSYETVKLIKEGEAGLGMLNIVFSNIVCIAMTVAGILAAKFLLKIVK